jgi:hypothetical protein
MARGLAIVVMLAVGAWACPASAQVEIRGEQVTLEGEAREVTGLYVSGALLFGTGALLSVFGGLTVTAGDSIGPGIALLPAGAVLGAFGITLLSIAAGYDAGVTAWNRAAHGSPDGVGAARSELSSRIAWTYGIGVGVFVASMAAIVVMYGIDQSLPPGSHLQAGHYMVPTGVSVLGIATMLAAAGMDIAAGAWSPFVPVVSPLPGGGVMATGTGTF